MTTPTGASSPTGTPATGEMTASESESAMASSGEQKAAERSGRVGKYVALTLSVLAVLGLACVLLWTINRFFGSDEPTITSTSIGATFSDIAELAVEEYAFSNVGEYDEAGLKVFGIDVPLTGKNFLITYDGVVKAGISDTTEIAIDVDDSSAIVRLTVPGVEVTETSIDPGSITVYDQSMNPFNQIGVDDLATFLETEEDNAQARAIDNGLLTRAQQRTESLLVAQVEAMLEATEQTNYTVVVEWEKSFDPGA